jgi:hypothetical protein
MDPMRQMSLYHATAARGSFEGARVCDEGTDNQWMKIPPEHVSATARSLLSVEEMTAQEQFFCPSGGWLPDRFISSIVLYSGSRAHERCGARQVIRSDAEADSPAPDTLPQLFPVPYEG